MPVNDVPEKNGFSLIELLIVVAIILVIVAIAIPNFLRARIAANEASAGASLRAIASAQATYFAAYPTIGYSGTLLALGGAAPCTPGPASACVLDTVLSNAGPGVGKSGYQFVVTGIPLGGINGDYVAGSSPMVMGLTGDANFCSTSEQILRIQRPGGGPPVTTVGACAAYPIAP